MKIDEVTRRDFLKGLGAAGVAAATGAKLPGAAAPAAAAATTAAAAAPTAASVSSLVAAAADWVKGYFGSVYINTDYDDEDTEWDPGENDLTEIGEKYGLMPWGSEYHSYVSPNGVKYLYAEIDNSQLLDQVLVYQDPKSGEAKVEHLDWISDDTDDFTAPDGKFHDDHGNTIDKSADSPNSRPILDRKQAGEYVDRMVSGVKFNPEKNKDQIAEPEKDQATSAVKTLAKHGAADAVISRLAQLAGVKALSSTNSKKDEPITPVMNPDDMKTADDEPEDIKALPDLSNDDSDEILKTTVKPTQTIGAKKPK